MDKKFLSRRWILTCAIFLVSTIGLFNGNISEAVWRDLQIALIGIYAAAGTTEKIKSSKEYSST